MVKNRIFVKNRNFQLYLSVQSYGPDLRLSILRKVKAPLLEKRAELLDLTKSEFVEFVENFVENCWIQGLVQGNFQENEAIEMFKNCLETLNPSQTYNYCPNISVLQLPDAPHVIKRRNLNSTDQNSFENWYWQIGKLSIQEEIK